MVNESIELPNGHRHFCCAIKVVLIREFRRSEHTFKSIKKTSLSCYLDVYCLSASLTAWGNFGWLGNPMSEMLSNWNLDMLYYFVWLQETNNINFTSCFVAKCLINCFIVLIKLLKIASLNYLRCANQTHCRKCVYFHDKRKQLVE